MTTYRVTTEQKATRTSTEIREVLWYSGSSERKAISIFKRHVTSSRGRWLSDDGWMQAKGSEACFRFVLTTPDGARRYT